MAKFTIPASSLPATATDGTHTIRFRVISEDRNNISEWSRISNLLSSGQIPTMSPSYTASLSGVTSLSGSTTLTLKVTWDGGYLDYHNEVDQNSHDIYIKWNNNDYIYLGREQGNNFSVIVPPNTSTIKVWVQGPTYPTGTRSETLKIFETTSITTDIPISPMALI